MVKPKILSLADVEKLPSHEPIYVVNATKDAQRSNLVITIPNESGSRDEILTVLATWLPLCATDYVRKELLLRASNFRRAVAIGRLEIISKESAEELLSQPGAIEEDARVKELMADSMSIGTSMKEDSSQVEVLNHETSNIRPSIVQLTDLLPTVTEIEAINTLRSSGAVLTKDEKELIIKTAKSLDMIKLIEFVEAD